MGRTTVYNKNLTTDELWNAVDEENRELVDDFIVYKKSANRSPKTIEQYYAMLKIFFIWNISNNKNLFFVNTRKKTFIKFMFYMIDKLNYSPNRIASMKSVLSSLGAYIESVLSDEYPTYRNPIRGLESPAKAAVRDKTVLTDEIIQKALDSLVEKKLYQPACYLACATASGARKAELLQFRVSYFADENKVFNGCMWKTGQIRTKGRGNAGKPLAKFVFVKQFLPYLQLWMEERKRLGIESDWLFVSEGHQATVNNANTWCDTISRHMESDFYSHSCRHYWTTSLKQQKLPDDVIVSLMGWEKGTGGAMVSIYNDVKIEDTLGEYFDENGIKIIE